MFKKLSKILTRKKEMINTTNFAEKSLPELKAEFSQLDFQWIKGENAGDIERFSSVDKDPMGNTYLCFRSGRRVNVTMIDEFLVSFPFTGVDFDAPPVNPPIMKEDLAMVQKTAKVNSINYDTGTYKYKTEESPIYKLLRKQKPNWVNVNISIKLNLPTKNLYNVLLSSFDEAEQEIVEYIVEGVDIEDIKGAISESIKTSFYEAPSKKNNKTNPIISDDEILDA